MTTNAPVKIGLLFLGRKRPGFDMEWGRVMEERVRLGVGETELQVFEPPEKVVDDASLRAAVKACVAEEVDVLVLLQTTMGDARLAPTLAQLWPDPLVVWATPENQQGEIVSSCSLVGAHAWATTLRQMGHAFELVYGHPDEPDTRDQLMDAVRLAATVRALRSVRVGVVGGQAPGFFTMSVDPFSLHRGLGVQLQTFSLVEFADVVNSLSDEEVAEDVARVKTLGLAYEETGEGDLPMSSRLYLAMRHFMDNERIDALAVRCWPEMANMFDQWPYLGIARLADEGRAIACEGDADGALCAWVGESLGMGRCYLSDWLEHDDETITLWHGGAAPLSLSPPAAPEFARHFNSKKPGVVDATITAGLPVTMFRMWRMDGAYHFTAAEGQTIEPRRHLLGTNALAKLDDKNPHDWFEELCHQGMPHHVAVFVGRYGRQLKRFARQLGMRWVD